MKVLILFTDEGYDLASEEYKIGINCIGVPIFGRNGAMAAISITGPASRFTLDEMGKVKGELMAISKEISNQL
ncbi:MAG: IclR family transcriptional regulator C-terminal domain-containing protein [Atribacterota bacterium]|nr:IclR family transcriptional regulator C-terminal domain-containing protein [Atribacterota bacterium]